MKQPITALQTPDNDWLLHRFIEVNFAKLMNRNQIFRNDFVGLHYHLCKISSQIIECIIFAPNELSIITIHALWYASMLLGMKQHDRESSWEMLLIVQPDIENSFAALFIVHALFKHTVTEL